MASYDNIPEIESNLDGSALRIGLVMSRFNMDICEGLLAAEHGSNIGNVSMEEEDGSPYTVLFFTVEVENRMHLARVMRGLRTQPDVVRIYRIKGKKDGRAAPTQ